MVHWGEYFVQKAFQIQLILKNFLMFVLQFKDLIVRMRLDLSLGLFSGKEEKRAEGEVKKLSFLRGQRRMIIFNSN